MINQELLFSPSFEDKRSADAFSLFVKEIVKLLKKKSENQLSNVLAKIREEAMVSSNGSFSDDELKLRLAQNVLLDLIMQGWELKLKGHEVHVSLEEGGDLAQGRSKDYVRRGHLIERDAQLQESSVIDFIKGMEKRRLTEKGWHSIFSLMREGKDLAEKLKKLLNVKDEESKIASLRHLISPYIQIIQENDRCEFTGLKLGDIWRYFRHTWVNAYRPIPGRCMQILIRDAATPNHPIIGIAALGSSAVQQSVRDVWIGWEPETFLKSFLESPSALKAKWIISVIQDSIDGIYLKDLKKEKIINTLDLEYPSSTVVEKLNNESERAIDQHKRFPDETKSRMQEETLKSNMDWERATYSKLYRSKRCSALADLLSIKKTLQECGLKEGTKSELDKILSLPRARDAVKQLVRFKKSEHVGIDMMDIIVCGSIPPYNYLLGGKLVCMLLCSPEVVTAYSTRYKAQPSIIASAMKGEIVIRTPQLVLLGTTSLYGIGSSQYNRIKIPATEVGGNQGDVIQYLELGHSQGFGSYHLSNESGKIMKLVLGRQEEGHRVHSIFGEGVSPRMRYIREALDLIGLPAENILRHGNKRVVYVVQLAKNAKEILLGFEKKPEYLIPKENPKQKTELIVEYWRKRWLLNRSLNLDVINDVATHTLSYPITHGARVQLPNSEQEEGEFFPEES